MSQNLMEETLRLLEERQDTLPEIYVATGLNYYWLRKFKSREMKDPSVNKVQKLYEYLAGRKLIPVTNE